MSNYVPILMLLIASVGLAVIMLALTTLVGPKRTNPVKELPFETGNLPTEGSARERYPIHFYLVAILFVVFDIEIAFLFPWAVRFKSLGLFGLIEMVIFLVILFVGWFFVIRRGVLKWR